MDDEHATLFQQAVENQPGAIDSLLQRHIAGLRAFVRLRTGKEIRDRESVSDLVQSVCLEVLEGVEGFEYRGEAPFRCWLFNLALSKIRDRHRRYSAKKRDIRREARARTGADYGSFYADLVTPSQLAIGREESERLEAAFDSLPDHYREVITLSRIVGLSHREVGERIGKGETACRGMLRRALTALHWALTDDQ